MNINQEIRTRILAAADDLWAKAQAEGSDRWPTVDTVRKTARVSMNDASAIMREWRQAQIQATNQKITVEIPERVREAVLRSTETLWQSAQALADEQFSAARQQWEEEQRATETMRKELADAYDAAQSEIDNLHKQINEVRATETQMLADYDEQIQRLNHERQQLESRAVNAEQDAKHLRSTTDRLEMEAKELHSQMTSELERRIRSEQMIDGLRSDLAKMQTQVDVMEQEQEDLREQLTSAQQRSTKAEQRAEDLEAQIAHMQTTVDHANQQHKEAVTYAERERDELRNQLDAANDRAARAEQRAQDLLEELIHERQRLDTFFIQKQ